MLILTASDVRKAIGPAEAYEAVQSAFLQIAANKIIPFERQQLTAGPNHALMGLMPVADTTDQGHWAIKVVLVGKENRAIGLDSHQGFVFLADGRTGQPIAMIDATSITALRTAAASAVASNALALPDPGRIAILGGGTQAKSHAEALCRLYPQAELILWARSNGAALAEELGAIHAATPADAAKDAQVICTITGAAEPILSAQDVSAGTHINAVGASRPTAREISGSLLAQCRVFVDSRAQAETECGEVLLARSEGAIAQDFAITELHEVLTNTQSGRTGPDEITLFKSLGIAAEDLAVGMAALNNARDLGIGVTIEPDC